MGAYENAANTSVSITLKYLKDRMDELGINQSQLSNIIGVSKSTVKRWFDKDRDMSLTNYYKMCGALELRPYLIPKEDDDNEMEFIHFN